MDARHPAGGGQARGCRPPRPVSRQSGDDRSELLRAPSPRLCRALGGPLARTPSVPSGKLVCIERCRWGMPGEDAGSDVYWRYTRIRGQSRAPPGAPRMQANLADGALVRRVPPTCAGCGLVFTRLRRELPDSIQTKAEAAYARRHRVDRRARNWVSGGVRQAHRGVSRQSGEASGCAGRGSVPCSSIHSSSRFHQP